jgi:exopolyphosphatase/guanosine-5'-triphosphate,3'-diphosphate pyrophosphatase
MRDGLIFDLGGGSLQLARIRDGWVEETRSLPIGAVRMTERFFRNDPPSPQELASLRAEVERHLLPAIPTPTGQGCLAGIGGTVRTLASLRLATRADEAARHGLCVRQGEIAAIRARLES